MSGFFIELSIVLAVTVIISYFISRLNQPLIVGYIISGIVVGPLFLDVLKGNEAYSAFSHIGVALLLFIVGLHLNLKLIKEIGFVSLFAGFFQVLLTTFGGFLISYFFGFNFIVSMLLGIGISFSSTIIVVKLLSDKKELESVHGKIAMGILIFQDLIAVILLMVLASIASSEGINSNYEFFKNIFLTFFYGILLLGIVLLFSKIFIEKIFDKIAQNQDLLFIFIISWCLSIAALFNYLGFSVEIGALIAGVALASSPYQYEISSKVKPLRDFFLVIFFILLGSQMIPVDSMGTNTSSINFIINNFAPIFIPSLVLSLFVIVIKPLIIFLILNFLRFHKREAFYTSISLSQISEFSLIMILIASSIGLVESKIISIITLVAIITITISTYLNFHGRFIYNKLSPILSYLEFRTPKRDREKKFDKNFEILIFGYDKIGYSLIKAIDKLNKKYLIVDYNPLVIDKLEKKNIPCVYGDASDISFLEELEMSNLNLVISTIPDFETNMILLEELRKVNKSAIIILTSNDLDEALELYKQGADYVILPHYLGGNYLGSLIENFDGDFREFLKEKVKHLKDLKESFGK